VPIGPLGHRGPNGTGNRHELRASRLPFPRAGPVSPVEVVVVIAAFFVIGIGVGVAVVVALSARRHYLAGRGRGPRGSYENRGSGDGPPHWPGR